jgi:general secretion pathway protein N
MRAWVAVACGVVLLAAALLVEAPAGLVDWRIAALTGDRVHVANARGTLWNGSGDLVTSGSTMRRHITWRLEPFPLVRGELRGTLAGGGEIEHTGNFLFAHDRVELTGFDLALPMEALLRTAGAPALIASAGGDVGVRLDRFVRDGDSLDVALAVKWRNASLPALGASPRVMLGDVHCKLSGSGHEVSGPLANDGGEVEIGGTVTAVAGEAPRVVANIKPRPSLERERASLLAAALSTLGPADGEGRVRIAWPPAR